MTKRRRLAKLTVPALPDVVPRERLFKVIDTARKSKVVWICARPGSGKTTLAASYLRSRRRPCLWIDLDAGDADPAAFFHYLKLAAQTSKSRSLDPLTHLSPEYMPQLAVFAQRFFDALYQRVAAGAVIVFDNYHTLPADSAVHELVRIAATRLPRDVGMFVLSRAGPPPALARLLAEQRLQLIGDEALCLTETETVRLVRMHARGTQRRGVAATAHELHAATGGWLAGAVLMFALAADRKATATARRLVAPETLFDYFSAEVLGTLDATTRNVLLATAVLPSMTVPMAEALSDERSAGQVLAGLHRAGYFMERRSEAPIRYQYHPLFREFLLHRAAAQSSSTRTRALRARAAELLAADGQTEAAFALFAELKRFEEAVALVLAEAPVLMRQGRANVVAGWIDALPRTKRERLPWLLYWLGVARLATRPADASPQFERALTLFEKQGDRIAALLACAGAMDSVWYAWRDVARLDRWIDRLAKLAALHKGAMPAEIEAAVCCAMFNGLFWRRPGDPSCPEWARRLDRVIEQAPELDMPLMSAAVSLINYYANSGDLGRAERLLRSVDSNQRKQTPSPFAKLAFAQMRAVMATYIGDGAAALSIADEGLALGAEQGLAIWSLPLLGAKCLAELMQGDIARAQLTVEQLLAQSSGAAMPFRSWALCFHAWVERERGNLYAAHRAATDALDIMPSEGPFPETIGRFSMAQIEHALGRTAEAAVHVARAAQIAEEARCRMGTFGAHLMVAQLAFAGGDSQAALAALDAGMRVGAAVGYMEWQGQMCRDDLSFLCAKALEAQIEPDYVRALIRCRRLLPGPDVAHLEAWPWPVKIYTLGRFSLLRDGEPVTFAGKAQRRPLDLLKALIALGGRDVPQSRVAEALWPDADGDSAAAAFDTNVKRLRRLLGRADAVTLSAEKVAVNPRVCWVDAWSFEREVKTAADDIAATERALSSYRGPFLGAEVQEWSISLRERLQTRFLQGVRAIGANLESAKSWERAASLYERGLAADDLAEEFYQRLMICREQLGQRADALSAYARCERLLQSRLRIVPSAKTRELYERLTAPAAG